MTITKVVSLVGEAKESTIINSDGSGTVILIRHDNVTFTGFSVIYASIPHVPQAIWMWSTSLAVLFFCVVLLLLVCILVDACWLVKLCLC
ncbi:MAG: hypothetical protein GX638_08315 [Crenarchaeota archaeon]|nr:hypothetical protein [Thermoproteota archaeon]